MKKITAEQKRNLLSAIDLANNRGTGLYTEGDKMCCVIAHLASLEGVSHALIKRWDDGVFVILSKKGAPGALKPYPLELLHYLQYIHDNLDIDEETSKARMREMVEISSSDDFMDINKYAFSIKIPILKLSDR